MVRSLYSGVSGMKAHQSRMDVIGNNISNVNTYGFKASRATFSDVFYQSTSSASAPSANAGGTNPSEIGYGANLGSVDVLHGTSTMATTSNALDVAITGEGFFQVQDAAGNTFYTRAGLLDIDAYGNLVDLNGNFVLGVSGSPVGQPASSSRIQITIPSVDASAATSTESINGVGYTISSSNNTKDANLTMTFIEGSDLPIGQDVSAVITSSGITISVNPIAEFASLEDYNSAINSAINSAYGGTHPGGTFTVEMNPEEAWPETGLTGEEILGKNFGIKDGTIDIPSELSTYGFEIDSVGTAFGQSFSTEDDASWTVTRLNSEDDDTDDKEAVYGVTVTVGGVTYSGVATSEMLSSGTESLLLKQGTYAGNGSDYNDYKFTEATDNYDANDTITISVPTAAKFESFLEANGAVGSVVDGTATGTNVTTAVTTSFDSVVASTASDDLGMSGTPFILTGGTAGGPQGVEDLTGIAIGGDGIIYANHAVHGLMELGRIDLATFANPNGLTQVGSTYFQVTANSGEAQLATAGDDGTGAIASATLEMSSVDLSGEMADMITTQRGFQACSRMITVSDTMLEELINLKR